MYIHCQKIYNLFVPALETDRKGVWQAFLSCFATSANEFDIFPHCTYTVELLQSDT